MKSILTVTLNPAIDKTVRVKVTLSAGGKGLNVSRVIKTLGGKTIATGLIGGATGMFIKNKLNAEKIANDFFFVSGETRTNLTKINPKNGEITRVLEPGPVISKKEASDFRKKYCSLLAKSKYVVFTGSLPKGLKPGIYAELVKIAKNKNVATVLDTSKEALRLGIKSKPFILKPNLEELEEVIGRKLNSIAKIKEAIQTLHHKGTEIVIITMGEKGAVASNGKEILKTVLPKIKCINNVGSGDSFIGGFVYSYSKGKSFSESLKLAAACGSANALSINPGFCKKKDINKLLKKIKIERV